MHLLMASVMQQDLVGRYLFATLATLDNVMHMHVAHFEQLVTYKASTMLGHPQVG
jgi:hypothetical protein